MGQLKLCFNAIEEAISDSSMIWSKHFWCTILLQCLHSKDFSSSVALQCKHFLLVFPIPFGTNIAKPLNKSLSFEVLNFSFSSSKTANSTFLINICKIVFSSKDEALHWKSFIENQKLAFIFLINVFISRIKIVPLFLRSNSHLYILHSFFGLLNKTALNHQPRSTTEKEKVLNLLQTHFVNNWNFRKFISQNVQK